MAGRLSDGCQVAIFNLKLKLKEDDAFLFLCRPYFYVLCEKYLCALREICIIGGDELCPYLVCKLYLFYFGSDLFQQLY